MDIVFNEYLSSIEDLKIEDLPNELKELFYDIINNVPYVKTLISPNRKRAKDLPRDNKGRIIVDITQPHILEDMDYFRPTAINYQLTGKVNNLRPNANPNSEYGKWIREEVRRCHEGYVRESDGEWITGDMYFFLNYCPILLSKIKEGRKALRVWDFPEVWEGHYYKFHYIELARNNGHHGAELASRSKGKSFTLASMLAKRFILGEDAETKREVKCLATAYLKEYLTKDGLLNKFQSYIDFCALNTEFPAKRLKSSLQDMSWKMGYIDLDTNTQRGTLNEVLGVSSKDDESKLRGKRGVLIAIEEFGTFPNLLGLYGTLRPSVEEGDSVFGLIYLLGCVCAGTKVLKPNGEIINIEDVQLQDKLLGYDGSNTTVENISWKLPIGYKDCVRISTEKNNYLDCSTDHPILALNKDKFGHSLGTCSFYRANELKVGDTLLLPRLIGTFGSVNEPHAYLLGALFGDGNYSGNTCVSLSISTEEEYKYYNENYNIGISKVSSGDVLYAQIYFRGLHSLLQKYGMDKQAFKNKKLPNNIFDWDKESVCDFLGGYFNADGNIQIVKGKHRSIKLTCKYENILIQIKQLLHKLGISSHVYKEYKKERILKSKVNKTSYKVGPTDVYVLYISNSSDVCIFRDNIKFLIPDKQARLDSYIGNYSKGIMNNLRFLMRDNGKGVLLQNKNFDNMQAVTIKSIENLGVQRIYNMTADTTHTYISNGFISSNTAGDNESDFASALEIMYNPVGYNMLDNKNVYDKEGLGRPRFVYFFPGYLNRKGCYDENGNSDVTKAIVEILKSRHTVKYNSSDINAVTKAISEVPITPQEAILRTRGNLFPITQLNERLNQLDNNPNEYDDVYIGNLLLNKHGEVEFKPTSDMPIRDFPTKDNKQKGAIEIFQMPERDRDGKVYSNRYILGHDPKQSMGRIVVIL